MKQYEWKAVQEGRRYKYWEDIIKAKESYLKGYQQALDDIKNNVDIYEEIMVEFSNGDHQIYEKNSSN